MNSTLKRELPILLIALLPTAYLFFIWNTLPDVVPVHWDIKGKINGYGSKAELLFISLLLPFLIYIIFLVVPKIDPKAKLNNMGGKLQNLKFILTTFMSLLAIWILYSAKKQSIGNPNYVITGVGILFLILGNYFKTIKPNYFIGIRTPWTLESETNWRETHKLAGKIWFGGGLLIVLFSFVLNAEMNQIFFLTITAIIVVIPVVYSYLFYRKEKRMA